MKLGDLIKFNWGFGGSISTTGILLEIREPYKNPSWPLGKVYVKYEITILTPEGRQNTYDIWSTDEEPEVLSDR